MYRIYENSRTIHDVAFLGELTSTRGFRIHVCVCSLYHFLFYLGYLSLFPASILGVHTDSRHVATVWAICALFELCFFSFSCEFMRITRPMCVSVCVCALSPCALVQLNTAPLTTKAPVRLRSRCVRAFVLYSVFWLASRVFPSDISKIEFFRVQRIPCVSCITTNTH